MNGFQSSRRRLLFGRPSAPDPVRPPWSAADRLTDLCSRCGACAAACPEGLIRPGDGGFPELDFSRGECSFCRACGQACPVPAIFDFSAPRPWDAAAAIGEACLARHGIHCQTCRDICPETAVRFHLALGRPPQPALDDQVCTGCGACVAACPGQAIAVTPHPLPQRSAHG